MYKFGILNSGKEKLVSLRGAPYEHLYGAYSFTVEWLTVPDFHAVMEDIGLVGNRIADAFVPVIQDRNVSLKDGRMIGLPFTRRNVSNLASWLDCCVRDYPGLAPGVKAFKAHLLEAAERPEATQQLHIVLMQVGS